jgi:hypothetical protein
MVCGGCAKRRFNMDREDMEATLYGNRGSLNNRQIVARLEKYKKVYCSDRECRYKCDYTMFTECEKK